MVEDYIVCPSTIMTLDLGLGPDLDWTGLDWIGDLGIRLGLDNFVGFLSYYHLSERAEEMTSESGQS